MNKIMADDAMLFHVSYDRTVPARRPSGHVPHAPRYSTRWSKPIATIVSDYLAIQMPEYSAEREVDFLALCASSSAGENGPDCYEIFRSTDKAGVVETVFVAYWLEPVAHARWTESSEIYAWFRDDSRLTDSLGAWRETIAVPYDRHETINSEPDYPIGLGRTNNSVAAPITNNGYFGAARDRLPISAIDELRSPHEKLLVRAADTKCVGRRLRVDVPVNMVTLRSGHYWADAKDEQLKDYDDNIRPRFDRGMNYLSSNKSQSGTISLRIMTNLNKDGTERREISVLAHFLSMWEMEDWAKNHQTHLDIYNHAIAMNRKYGKDRQFVSWHELFINQSAAFEYVNCRPQTGLLQFFPAYEVQSA